jgi:hypothetical protein
MKLEFFLTNLVCNFIQQLFQILYLKKTDLNGSLAPASTNCCSTLFTSALDNQEKLIVIEKVEGTRLKVRQHHHQPINVPTAGAQAFLMDNK